MLNKMKIGIAALMTLGTGAACLCLNSTNVEAASTRNASITYRYYQDYGLYSWDEEYVANKSLRESVNLKKLSFTSNYRAITINIDKKTLYSYSEYDYEEKIITCEPVYYASSSYDNGYDSTDYNPNFGRFVHLDKDGYFHDRIPEGWVYGVSTSIEASYKDTRFVYASDLGKDVTIKLSEGTDKDLILYVPVCEYSSTCAEYSNEYYKYGVAMYYISITV